MSSWRSIARAVTAFICALGFAGAALAADPAPAKKDDAPKPVIKTFGSWHTSCVKTEKNGDECHAFVQVATKEKQVILYLGIGYARAKEVAGKLSMFTNVPLGTLLPAGIKISIDDKNDITRPFLFCAPGGCRADMLIDDAELKAIKSGKEMEVTFTLIGNGEVKIPLKLDGISAAIKSLPVPKKS